MTLESYFTLWVWNKQAQLILKKSVLFDMVVLKFKNFA